MNILFLCVLLMKPTLSKYLVARFSCLAHIVVNPPGL